MTYCYNLDNIYNNINQILSIKFTERIMRKPAMISPVKENVGYCPIKNHKGEPNAKV